MKIVQQLLKSGLRLKINLVCRGGPENGPFSAAAARVINLVLPLYGLSIDGINTVSGPTPTAILGCYGDFDRLCNIWAHLTPKDIVGKRDDFIHKIPEKTESFYRIIRGEALLRSDYLKKLLKDHGDLDAVFDPTSTPIKFSCVDLYSGERIVFSNKDLKFKGCFWEGAMGSMSLTPFFGPQIIENPERFNLISENKIKVLKDRNGKSRSVIGLVDGGYKEGMLLEEAIRDGYNLIFIIDIHNLSPTLPKVDSMNYWPYILATCSHYLSNANDVRQFRATDRVNEEIRFKIRLKKLATKLSCKNRKEIEKILEEMNIGRLRLRDKQETYMTRISDSKNAVFFNFANFKPGEIPNLLRLGHNAAVRKLKKLGFEFDEKDPKLDLERVIAK